jgi:hypothetical protein
VIDLSVTFDWIRMLPDEEFSLNHLREETCCCRACNGSYSKLWFEAAGACPEGLVRKQIIDRLGRKQNRCVRRDEVGTDDSGSSEDKQAASDAFVADIKSKSHSEHDVEFANKMFEGNKNLKELEDRPDARGWKSFVNRIRVDMGALTVKGAKGIEKAMVDWTSSSVVGGSHSIHQSMISISGDREDRHQEDIGAIVDRINENAGSGPKGESKRKGAKKIAAKVFDDTSDKRLVTFSDSMKASMDIERAFWEEQLGEGGTITLYRGVQVDAESVELGAAIAQDLAASSWSSNPREALGFGNTLMKREVKPEEIIMSIFSHIDMSVQSEFVLYTPDEGADVEVMAIDKEKTKRFG